MPGYSGVTYGNVANTFVIQFNGGTIGSAGANTTTNVTFNVPGLLPSDQISAVQKPTFQAGLVCESAICLAAGVLTVQYANITAAPITVTPNETYLVEVNRGVNPPSYPTAIE